MHATPPTTAGDEFTVLAVCTGNICRSPAVERLLTHGLGEDSDVHVESAGVGAVVGAPLASSMARLLADAGVRADGFTARQVDATMLRAADLVLTLTRAHRSRVVELHPAAVRRTFTLRELARLADAVGPAALPAGSHAERLAALVPLAAAQRGLHPGTRQDDDVVDPYGGDDRLYVRSFGQLRPAVDAIVRTVRG